LNKIGTRRTKDDLSGEANDMIISRPVFGKHIKFDGRLLHAAPSDLLEEEDSDAENEDDGSGSESDSSSDDDNDDNSGSVDDNSINDINISNVINKDETTNGRGNDSDPEESDSDEGFPKRITFLVNIWLNHMPIQSKSFPEVRLKDLKSNLSLSSSSSYFQEQSSAGCMGKNVPKCPSSSDSKKETSLFFKTVPSIAIESQFSKPSENELKKPQLSSEEILYQERIWKFSNGGRKYQITIPLPFSEQFHTLTQEHDAFKLLYNCNSRNARIERITKSKKIENFNENCISIDKIVTCLNANDVVNSVSVTNVKPLSEREERRKRLRDASLKPAH
jgi:hypothetical protein